jgi:antitoxin CcdA
MSNAHQGSRAPKRAVNLSINAELLAETRRFGLNLSELLEERLFEAVRQARREEWVANNRPAIEDYNARVDERGSYGDTVRRF